MDTKKLTASLTQLFDNGNRLIFWQDPEGEFRENIDSLAPEGVTLLDLDELAALEVKTRVELEEPESRFLLYATGQLPVPDEDWLLDIRLYAESFSADRSAMILKELGLTQQRLRGHIAARARFFASKDRLTRLRRLVHPDDGEADIDRKIMAVLTRIDQPELFPIVIALFHAFPDDDPARPPPEWAELERYGVAEVFWRLVADAFGYDEAQPSLKNLLIRLMVTDFGLAAGRLPYALEHLGLPGVRAANAMLCLGQWRDSASRHESFDALSATVAQLIKLEEQLSAFGAEELLEVKTFLLVEQSIARQLRDRIIQTANTLQAEDIREAANRRQDGYWANRNLPSTSHVPRDALSSVYDALIAAAELFDLKNRQAGFAYPTAEAFYTTYCRRLYRFDQRYRHFCEAADRAEAKGWDILKDLRAEVEAVYGNWYLASLALTWGEWLEGGLLAQWKIDGVDNQYAFYERHVAPVLRKAGDRRVFVIISDAFRYECAQELTEQLNGQYRFTAELLSQLGVLPSYTALGMAALLPHKELAYNATGAVLVDGQSSAGLDNRSRILASVQGVAIKAEEFMAMNQGDGRAFIKPYRVVYIYHNQVDATGDSASTEDNTFAAVRTAIDEIGGLVNKAINSLNGNYLLVTADHGFLFQESQPKETEKNAISSKPGGAVVMKKRYMLGAGFPEHPKVYRGETDVTARTRDGLAFWIPRGIGRFHFVSGARFVHGGAMPQEVVVPVIRVQQLKGKQAEKTRTRTVGVSVLGNGFTITTNRYKVRLIQTEALSDRIKPLTVKLAIYEGAEPVTNLETVTFDGASGDLNEWRREVWLILANRTFSNKIPYHLILRNAETDVEEARIEVSIDLAFTNDF